MGIRSRSIAALYLIMLALSIRAAAEPQLQVHNNRLFLPITVNGHQTEALLDSAAEMSLIDDDLARTLRLQLKGQETLKGSGGESSTRFADNVTIQAAGVALEKLTVGVLDLNDVSSRLIGRPVSVIVGRELFDAARLEIDIEAGTIHTLERTFVPQGVELRLISTRGIETAPAEVEGASVQADLDLGNGSDVLVGRKFAERHGLTAPSRIVERKVGGGLGGSVHRDIIVLSELKLAGHTFHDVRAAIDDQQSAGDLNIGMSVLRPFVVVTDFAEHKIWLRLRDH